MNAAGGLERWFPSPLVSRCFVLDPKVGPRVKGMQGKSGLCKGCIWTVKGIQFGSDIMVRSEIP